ncbi:MAG: 4-alpha-glucanotransferase [Tissierellia bacterium]|nr:4-alpha-glucanotransferase [Tissierellia bacterium]
MLKRSSGILLPVFSLPSKYGIGTLGREAYRFIDFLYSAGQRYWQILPLGPTSYGDSPYSTFSVFAGNPYFIDLEILVEEELILQSDLENLDFGSNDECIDYKKLFDSRYIILRQAYKNNEKPYDINYFIKENPWVEDYAFFMALKYKNNQLPWYKWDEKLIYREETAIHAAKKQLKYEINFWIFLQYLFFKQYFKLKEYANKKGISIIGDMPIYAAEDSVDLWIESSLFLLDENKVPKLVAGVPPDDFSEQGQLWGNPVFNWGYLKETGYRWWINRISFSFRLYDLVRIDHFRGFDEFWAVPYGSENAVKGCWQKSYGKELFLKAKKELGSLNIIAEDLGIITDSVIKLKNDLAIPGMKVLQFAFDGNPDNPYLPNNYEENSVAYTGTHDNDTLKGWYEKLRVEEKQYLLKALNIVLSINENEILDEIIRTILKSKAHIVIIPIQDYLQLGSKARINTPSTLGGNWKWRIKKEMLTNEIAFKIQQRTIESGRINKP